MGVNAGGGKWANHDFLPESRLDRGEDGRYWYERVAVPGAFVRAGGRWVSFIKRSADGSAVDAALLAVNNASNTATIFVMSDASAKEPWINDQNACMHLKPCFSASLAPDETATVHCRIGVSRRGLEDVWRQYRELPKRE